MTSKPLRLLTRSPGTDARPTAPAPRLTSLSPAGGCGCKLDPLLLTKLLSGLGNGGDDGWDDAAVFKHDGSSALVYTIDFFTPLVDDPHQWGEIAAAHALSDIYAMGGKPILALSVAAWARDQLPLEQLGDALSAAKFRLEQAGASLAGGHTIWDSSPKLGFTVVGSVDEDTILRKSAGRDGDVLVLTKPLGSGVVCSALKHSAASLVTVEAAVDVMTGLNAGASAAAVRTGIRCATDVTGFGLAGHLRDLATASGVGATIHLASLPSIPGALDLLPAFRTSNARSNRAYASPCFDSRIDPDDPLVELLFDPQSSGGLLLACPPNRLGDLGVRLRDCGAGAAAIGHLTASSSPGAITVERGPPTTSSLHERRLLGA